MLHSLLLTFGNLPFSFVAGPNLKFSRRLTFSVETNFSFFVNMYAFKLHSFSVFFCCRFPPLLESSTGDLSSVESIETGSRAISSGVSSSLQLSHSRCEVDRSFGRY